MAAALQQHASTTWIFASPQLIRNTTDGKKTQYYSFNIDSYNPYPETLTGTIDIFNELESPAIEIQSDFLNEMYSAFLKTHGSRFAKPYTPSQLINVTKHSYNLYTKNHIEQFIFQLIPSKLNIIGNTFTLYWNVIAHDITIDFEEEEEEVKEESGLSNEIRELEEVDVSSNVQSVDDFLRLNSTEQDRDTQNLLKAKLKARLARYKAEKALAKYISKYGKVDDELLDSDDSDSESDDDVASTH